MAFLFRYLAARGIDPQPLAAQCRWQPPELDGLDPSLPLMQFYDLLEQAARLTDNPDLGLDYYREADPAELGRFGFAQLHAASIADALQLNARYHQMLQNNTHVAVLEDPAGILAYEFRVLDDEIGMSRFDNDLSIAGITHLIRTLAQRPHWKPLAAQFMHPQPPSVAAYESILCCPVTFDAPCNRLSIDADIANTPVVGGDARLFRILDADLQRLAAAAGEDHSLVNAVRLEVSRELPLGLPTIDRIAASLDMSQRSLQRRLTECGVTYKQLVDNIREQMSRQYLEDADNSLVEVALMLGYSELSAFIRAFRRWSGQTPQQYRRTSRAP